MEHFRHGLADRASPGLGDVADDVDSGYQAVDEVPLEGTASCLARGGVDVLVDRSELGRPGKLTWPILWVLQLRDSLSLQLFVLLSRLRGRGRILLHLLLLLSRGRVDVVILQNLEAVLRVVRCGLREDGHV